jgi:hypothetical protein
MLVSIVVLVSLGGLAHADGYKMQKYPDNKCGNIRARALAPLELLMDAPSEATVEDRSVKGTPGAFLGTEDFHWAVRVIAASKKDLDFAKAKKLVIDQAKKAKTELVWKTAEKTADGYRLLYSEKDKASDEVEYTTLYLRTVGKKKWVCWSFSTWADTHECISKACESLHAP